MQRGQTIKEGRRSAVRRTALVWTEPGRAVPDGVALLAGLVVAHRRFEFLEYLLTECIPALVKQVHLFNLFNPLFGGVMRCVVCARRILEEEWF
jgi:hypothetical protein